MLKDRNIVVQKKGNRIYLPTKEILDVESSGNIPHKPYTMCRITDYDAASGTLHLTLLPDVVNEKQFATAVEVNSAVLISSYIRRLDFVNWSPKVFSPATQYEDRNRFDRIYDEKWKKHEFEDQFLSPDEPNYQEKSIENIETDLTIEIPVNELKFETGKVTFEYLIYRIDKKVQFDIYNPFIKKEFDAIKNYFAKALGTKKFIISIHIVTRELEIISRSATSSHVSRIDSSLFEIVEELCIEDSFINNSEDEIYYLNEKATQISLKAGSEKIQDADWLLNRLFTKERTKHYFHLRYLSSKHLKDVVPLRITGKPISFIFLLSRENGFSLVWETYSTDEATYVWNLNNMNSQELQAAAQTLVERIKWLRQNNKMEYIRQRPGNFTRIEHDYTGDDLGFKKWNAYLEQFMSTDIGLEES